MNFYEGIEKIALNWSICDSLVLCLNY